MPPPQPVDEPRRRFERHLEATARLTHALLPDADGFGVSVALGDGTVFGGSNAFTQAIDEVQYTLREGPCETAVASGRIISSSRIDDGEERWPSFTPAAAALELRGVLSVPMVVDDAVVGSLNLYSRTPSGLQDVPRPVIEALVAEVEAALRHGQLLTLVGDAARDLQQALRDRADVELTVGVLMDRYATDAASARVLVDQLARQEGTTVLAAARSILTEAGLR